MNLSFKVTSLYLERETSLLIFLKAVCTRSRCSASRQPSLLKYLTFTSARSRSTLRRLETCYIPSSPTFDRLRKCLKTNLLWYVTEGEQDTYAHSALHFVPLHIQTVMCAKECINKYTEHLTRSTCSNTQFVL